MNLLEYKDQLARVLCDNPLSQGCSEEVANIMTRANLQELICAILCDSSQLETVARNSYKHSLGFSKIVLFDSSNLPNGEELRIHIWWPNKDADTRLYIEEGDKHEHNWDFASRLIHGGFRNFLFKPVSVSDEDRHIVEEFERSLRRLDDDIARINLIKLLYQLEVEVILGERNQDCIGQLSQITGLSDEKILRLLDLYWKFRNKKIPNFEQEEYTRDGIYFLERQPEWGISEGNIYYHPREFGHYLYNDPTVLTSTFLLTGTNNANSGAFYHSPFTVEDLSSEDLPRQGFSTEAIVTELERYLSHF